MAFSSTMMLPPLYEIHRSMENVSRKYGNKVYLNALLPDDEADLKYEGAAPKSTVNGFMSNLGDQLYRLNVIQGTIKNEKKQRVMLVNMYFAVSIILTITLGGFITYLTVVPKLICSINTLDKVEAGYFIAIVVLIIIYIIIVSVRLMEKSKGIYDKIYNTDVFNTDQISRHIFEMVKFKNGTRFNEGDTINAEGTNPLAAYFIHRNKGLNVKFKFVETRAICKDGKVFTPTTSCAGAKKSYSFASPSMKSTKSSAYTLDCSGDNGLLNSTNLPCSIIDANGRMVVDPFIDGFNNPKLLKKKLERFDFFGQVNRLRDSVTYFKAFLSKQYDEQGGPLTENRRMDLESQITNVLKLDFLVIRGITPYENSLQALGKRPFTTSPGETIISCGMLNVCRMSCFISDNMGSGYGYGLTVNDISKLVFRFENNPKSENFIVIKATDVQLKLVSDTPPTSAVITSLFNNGVVMTDASKIPLYGACVANVKDDGGAVCRDSIVHTPLRKTPFGPAVTSIFAETPVPEVGERSVAVSDEMFLFNIDATSLFKQSMNMYMDTSLIDAKPLLIKRILDILEAEDPGHTFTFETASTSRITNGLKAYFGTTFQKVTSIINDILVDVPIELGKRLEAAAKSEADDPRMKYITYDRFIAKLSSLTQTEFSTVFLKHVETMRATASGLKHLYETYNFKDDAHQKNMEVLDLTWIILVVIGLCELLRFGARNFLFAGTLSSCENDKEIYKDDNERTHFKKSIKQRTPWAQAGLQIALFLMVYVLVVALIYSWKEKSRGIFTFNNIVLNNNGDAITVGTQSIQDTFVEAIIKDGQFIMVSKSYNDTGDFDETYDNIMKAMLISGGDTKVNLDAGYDLEYVHENFINTIEAYDKCNTLLSTSKMMPFPLTEITLYLMMIVVIVILALLVIFKLHPFEKISSLQKWVKIRRMMDRNIKIDVSSYGFDFEDDGLDKADIENTITVTISILVAIISIMFALMIIGNTNIFVDALYASDLFKNSECYNV